MARPSLLEEVRRIYTREHPVFQASQWRAPESDAVDKNSLNRLAQGVAETLGERSEDTAAITAPLQVAFTQIRNTVAAQVDEQLRRLSEEWHSRTSDLARLERQVQSRREVAEEAEAARRQSENILMRTQALLWEETRVPRHLRTMPTVLYVLILAITSGIVGLLSATSFRVLRLNDPTEILFACMYSVIFAISVHAVPQGFGSGSRRTPVFITSLVVLALLIASGVALGVLRGSGDIAMGSSILTELLLALTTSSALLGAFLYGREDAIALRQARREVAKNLRNLRVAKDALRELENRLERRRLERFEAVNAVVRAIQRHQTSGEELQTTFVATLRRLRAGVDWPKEIPVIEMPEAVEAWEEWLKAEAREIHHPVRAVTHMTAS